MTPSSMIFKENISITRSGQRFAQFIKLRGLDTMSASTLNSYLTMKAPPLENKRKHVAEMLNMIVIQQRILRLGEDRLNKIVTLANELITGFSEFYHLK